MSRRYKIISILITAVFVLTFFSGCDGLSSNLENQKDLMLADAETRLNPGKSLFDMMKEMTFDGIKFTLPCKANELPEGFSLINESYVRSGDRYELLYNGKVAAFVIIKNNDSIEKATVDIISIDLVATESNKEKYCDFKVSDVSFNKKNKTDIETIFADYTYTGDKSLLVYSFIDGSVIFNFDEKGLCKFIVIGGGAASSALQ